MLLNYSVPTQTRELTGLRQAGTLSKVRALVELWITHFSLVYQYHLQLFSGIHVVPDFHLTC